MRSSILVLLFLMSFSVISQEYRFSCSSEVDKIFEKALKYEEIFSNRKKDLQDARVVTIDNKRTLRKLYKYNTNVFYIWLIMRRVKLTNEICKLDSLQLLIIDSRKKPKFSEDFHFPNTLTFLSLLTFDSYDSIPEFIYNCKSLKGLVFPAISMGVVNDRVDNLIQLEDLLLHVEFLDSIPQSLCKLTNLCALYIYSKRENDIVSLPDNFTKLKKLKELDIPIDLSANIDLLKGMEIKELKVAKCTNPQIITADMFPKLRELVVDNISYEKLTILRENLPNTEVCYRFCGNKSAF